MSKNLGETNNNVFPIDHSATEPEKINIKQEVLILMIISLCIKAPHQVNPDIQ